MDLELILGTLGTRFIFSLSLPSHSRFQKDGESDHGPKLILFGGSEEEIRMLEAVEGSLEKFCGE